MSGVYNLVRASRFPRGQPATLSRSWKSKRATCHSLPPLSLCLLATPRTSPHYRHPGDLHQSDWRRASYLRPFRCYCGGPACFLSRRPFLLFVGGTSRAARNLEWSLEARDRRRRNGQRAPRNAPPRASAFRSLSFGCSLKARDVTGRDPQVTLMQYTMARTRDGRTRDTHDVFGGPSSTCPLQCRPASCTHTQCATFSRTAPCKGHGHTHAYTHIQCKG